MCLEQLPLLNVEINSSLSIVCSVAFFRVVTELLLETAADDAMSRGELVYEMRAKAETLSAAVCVVEG